MLRKKMFVLMCLFVLIVPMAFMVDKAGAKETLMSGKWWRIPRVAQEINLSEEEKKSLDGTSIEFRKKAIDLRSALERERLELDLLLEKEPLDESAALGQYKKVDAARSALSLERFKVLLNVRKVLGRDRYEILKQKFRAFKKKRGTEREKKK